VEFEHTESHKISACYISSCGQKVQKLMCITEKYLLKACNVCGINVLVVKSLALFFSLSFNSEMGCIPYWGDMVVE
jgi:hypothetical protein